MRLFRGKKRGAEATLPAAVAALMALAIMAAGCRGKITRPIPTTALWVTNANGETVVEFTAKQTKAGVSAPSPAVTNSSADLLTFPDGIAFDKHNNQWVSVCNGGTTGEGSLVKFTVKQLKGLHTSGAPAASVVISDDGTSLDCPQGLTFERSNLWVANRGKFDHFAQVVEYLASQLTLTGTPTPNTIITSAGNFKQPTSVKFDRHRNLWISDEVAKKIFGILAAHVPSSGINDIAPDVILEPSALKEPEDIAFDSTGNLWVADCTANSLFEFALSQLAPPGTSLAPAITITSKAVTINAKVVPTVTAPSLNCPSGLAFSTVRSPFSGVGNLWVANGGGNPVKRSDGSVEFGSVVQFLSSQIGASGSPVPNTFLDSNPAGSNLDFPFGIAFGPLV